MDTPSPVVTPAITTIDVIQKPTCVAFCGDKLFIAGSNGLGTYNTCTQLCTFLSRDKTYHLALHHNLHNLAASSKSELAVYDTKTETKKYSYVSLPKAYPVLFSSIENELCAYDNTGLFIRYHYLGGDTYYRSSHETAPCDVKNTSTLAYPTLHPHGTGLIYPSGKQTLTCISLPTFRAFGSIQSLQNHFINTSMYNPDGTMLAIRDNYDHCCIMDLRNNSNHLIQCGNDCNYISMAFHPCYNILALLTTTGSIEYWNYKTKQFIGITHEFYTVNLSSRVPEKYLDFNKKGSQIVAALDEKCVLLNCPQKYLPIIHYVLTNNGLPKELRFIIYNYLQDCLELKELNFLALFDI